MKDIFSFINSNAIVASLITLSISSIIQIIMKKSDRKYEENRERKKEKRQEFLNKAEFHIDGKHWDSKEKPDICLFMTDFNASLTKENDVVFNYDKNVLDSSKYKHMRFYLKNIGNADINELDICTTAQRNTMLCDIESVKNIVDDKFVNYNVCYDRKILKNDVILIDIAYLDNSKIFGVFSCELDILFMDSYGNRYRQPFFIRDNNIYPPSYISNKDFRIYTTVDTALECFKNPWMW